MEAGRMIDGSGREVERYEPGEAPYVLGMNAYPEGWLICRYEEPERRLSFYTMPRFADSLESHSRAGRIAVGVPIGLAEDGRDRRCDAEARLLLGQPRACSVFLAPARRVAHVESYNDACALSRKLCGKSIPLQAWSFRPKIAEVDYSMSPEKQQRVFEAHREVCFWGLNGKCAMRHNKATPEGYEERRKLLSAALCRELAKREMCNSRVLGVDPHSLLDTAAAALTAYRAFLGQSERLPREPEIDEKGLRMEMVY
jgi:predicted RNase H-like nuclease